MMKFLDAKNKIIKFYKDLWIRNGDYNPKSLSRISKETQEKRFESLRRLWSFTDKSVLDLWCGFGDFCWFLEQRYQNVRYTGIDIVEPFIVAAQKKYPRWTFYIQDMFTFVPEKNYDYIVANWAFSANIKDNRLYLDLIKTMFCYASIWFWRTMLKAWKHPNDEIFLSWNVNQIREFCLSLTPYVVIYEDYLPYDFTVFLYHKKV